MQVKDKSVTETQSIGQEEQVSKTKANVRGRASATPYEHGKGYAIRRNYKGRAIFLSGFKTMRAATTAMNREVREIDRNAQPWGLGPAKTSVAQALQDYALERLEFLKGASQEARRINNFLRAGGLRLLEVKPIDPENRKTDPKGGKGAQFEVNLTNHTTERKIPNGLAKHRKALLNANANTEKFRAVLASTPVNMVTRKLLQEYVNTMVKDGNSPATIALERSVLRVLFNHAFTTWGWTELQDNPATMLRMPAVDNERTRVLSEKEQVLLDQALQDCRNELAGPCVDLLRETAMRASEPLKRAKWKDVDWERRVLKLTDAKAGSREVPLSPGAIDALKRLQEMSSCKPDEPIVKVTYEALKTAWRRACTRAGIKDLHIHDLRHTAATRLALKSGNVFLVKVLTGHKTMKMVERYVNVKPEDVVSFMHQEPQPTPGKTQVTGAPQVQEPSSLDKNVLATSPAILEPKDEAACVGTQSQPETLQEGNVYRFPSKRVA